jgi:hypothetical protein
MTNEEISSENILAKIVIKQDLSDLSQPEQAKYLISLAESLGLNPMTKPFELMKTRDGRTIPYARKDCAEQLRKRDKVAITKIDTQIQEGVFVAMAYAALPDGRTDMDIGITSIAGLKGENLANACMKAITKAKRRVSLSICGLGIPDESEIDSFGAPLPFVESPSLPQLEKKEEEIPKFCYKMLASIRDANTKEELREKFVKAYKIYVKDEENLKRYIDAKDKRLKELEGTNNESEFKEKEDVYPSES